MKNVLFILAATLLVASSVHAQRKPIPITNPPAPPPDLSQRVIELERKVAQLQQATSPRVVVDSQGKVVGEILDVLDYYNAVAAINWRGRLRLIFVNSSALDGSRTSPRYLTPNCTGPIFYRAELWDSPDPASLWDIVNLTKLGGTGSYAEPRQGAIPAVISSGSYLSTNGCRAFSETLRAYQESDFETTVDPFAGFKPPFKIRRLLN